MTHKQIANRLREIIQGEGPRPYTQLELLADELDPPRPEPGTVVWWRYKYAGGPEYKYLGIVEDSGEGIIDAGQEFREWGDIEYKTAHILAPNEVAVPLEELIDVRKDISDGRYRAVSEWATYYVEHAEAEAK
jgi:hypothetical protein